jgi:hypothetical protein
MAQAQPQNTLSPDATRLEEIGADIIGGLRPFFTGTAAATLAVVGLAFIFSFNLNIWASLVVPVAIGIITALIFS